MGSFFLFLIGRRRILFLTSAPSLPNQRPLSSLSLSMHREEKEADIMRFFLDIPSFFSLFGRKGGKNLSSFFFLFSPSDGEDRGGPFRLSLISSFRKLRKKDPPPLSFFPSRWKRRAPPPPHSFSLNVPFFSPFFPS